jgi:hypothetical protein
MLQGLTVAAALQIAEKMTTILIDDDQVDSCENASSPPAFSTTQHDGSEESSLLVGSGR